MAAAYDKPFLMAAFMSRYEDVLIKDTLDERERYVSMVSNFYDKVGKDKFRVWASLDADAIKVFKASKK